MKYLISIPLMLGVTLLLVAGGCGRHNSGFDKSKKPTADSAYVKVNVTKSGDVVLDGRAAAIDELDVALAALAQKQGVVLFSREAPDEKEAHPMVKRVLDVVVKNRLRIRLCVKSDCSDALTADGKLRVDD